MRYSLLPARMVRISAAGATVALLAVAGVDLITSASAEDAAMKTQAGDSAAANKMLDGWPAGPRLAGQEMIAKYGAPREVTEHRIIWHDAGPFKRIMLTREELPHAFPLTHKDYLEHTISYKVPADKTDEVHAFDASISIHPVSGELSARCDLESNNVLTLNLAHDVMTGKKNVDDARREFGEAVSARTRGNPPPSTMKLLFQPMTMQAAAEMEKTTIEGTSQRAEDSRTTGNKPAGTSGMSAHPMKPGSDAEIMALVIALDENEVHAAMAAEMKQLDPAVMNFAKMLHQAHGKDIEDVQRLGMNIKVTPMETAAVDQLHAKGAAQLAKIVPLSGDAFGRAFLTQMIAGHKEALQMLDGFMKAAQNEDLKKHLATARQHIERHLKEALKMQGLE